MSVNQVGRASASKTMNNNQKSSPSNDVLKKVAKELNLSVDELKKMLQTSEVPKGKGIAALARENGMDMKMFCQLNGIEYSKWRDYKAKDKEVFYIIGKPDNSTKQKTTQAKPTPAKTETKPKQAQPKKVASPQKPAATQSPAANNKAKWGSDYTPAELAKIIFQKSKDYHGAVGKPDFDALVNQINAKNASAVIKEYKKVANESLLNTLAREVSSDKEKRMAAMKHVYDALAQEKQTPASVKQGFEKELNHQFDSVGLVNTKKLDETLNRMMASPAELAQKMKDDIHGKWGASGTDSFKELVALVTPRNAQQVIKAYDDLNTGETLIKGISREVNSEKEDRKADIMHVYDMLAMQKGSSASKRAKFQNELNKEFNSWGLVDTKNLDEMISNILAVKSTKSAKSVSKPEAVKTKAPSKPSEKIIKGGFIKATGGQMSVASTGAKPPIPVDEKGNVIAEVIKFAPSNPNGPLKNKTIMVNAGHGWKETKVFDQGTSAVDVKGKTIPEWYKNRNFADKLIRQLSAQGATVVYTTGGAGPVCNAKKKYKADMMISIHCNAADGNKSKNGLEVFYPEGSSIGKKFAQIAEKRLDEHVSFGKQDGPNDHCKIVSDITTRFKKIGLLQIDKHSTPSILVEMGYQSNEKDLKNIDWKEFQEKTMGKLVQSVKDYYSIK